MSVEGALEEGDVQEDLEGLAQTKWRVEKKRKRIQISKKNYCDRFHGSSVSKVSLFFPYHAYPFPKLQYIPLIRHRSDTTLIPLSICTAMGL